MELKTIKLQGRDYVQVAERIKYFRENVKDGRIETEVQFNPEHTRVIFIAKVYSGDKLISTAHSLKNITKEFELEKAETRAIGRALGIYGIGIDCGVSTYDEVREAIGSDSNEENYDKATEAQKKQARLLVSKLPVKDSSRIQFEAFSYSGASTIDSATKYQCDKFIDYLKNNS